jgi:hypothetical protein
VIGDAWLDESVSRAPLLCGLVVNPAAPLKVLLGLLETWPEQVCAGMRHQRDLSPPVQKAMLEHPSPRVRGVLAAHPAVDPQVRATLLADPHWRVRIRAFGRSGQRPLPDDVLVRLLAELDDGPPADTPFTREELIGEFFEAMRYDRHLIRLTAAHPRSAVRRYATGFLEVLDEPARRALFDDETPEVRQAAAAYVSYRQQVMQPTTCPASTVTRSGKCCSVHCPGR